MTSTWSGEHYANNTAHHRAYDSVLLERLRPIPQDGFVLDIGCGVGDFTAGLVQLVPDGRVLGIDADASMIATAHQLYADTPGLSFEVLPAQRLADASRPSSVDTIISTACLHWVPEADHPEVLSAALGLLIPGGQWCVEFGGAGQLQAMRAILDELVVNFGGAVPGWFFPEASTYRSLLHDAGFADIAVELLHQSRAMADAAALRGLLTSQVLVAYLPEIPLAQQGKFVEAACDAVVAAAESGSDSGRASNYDVEYVRVVARAVNPS